MLVIFTIIIYLIIDNYIKKNVSSEIVSRKLSKDIRKHDTYTENEVYSESKHEKSQQVASLSTIFDAQNLSATQHQDTSCETHRSSVSLEKMDVIKPTGIKDTSLNGTSEMLIPKYDQFPKYIPSNFYRSPSWKDTAQKVRRRDNFTCQQCGAYGPKDKIELHVHHIIPRGRGGSDALNNLITLCKTCHESQPHHNKLRNN